MEQYCSGYYELMEANAKIPSDAISEHKFFLEYATTLFGF